MKWRLKISNNKNKLVIDFTEKGNFLEFNNSVKKFLLRNKKKKSVEIIDYIYPITKLSKTKYKIKDHVNLSGINPISGPNFISLTNAYKSKDGIIVCQAITEPTKKEKNILLKANIKAYCFNLVPTFIFAKYLGLTINVFGVVTN